jgi:hypothetical protein
LAYVVLASAFGSVALSGFPANKLLYVGAIGICLSVFLYALSHYNKVDSSIESLKFMMARAYLLCGIMALLLFLGMGS